MARVGQTAAQTAQLTQSTGRINQGNRPSIARQSTGQTATQRPQPVHLRGSSAGSSRRRH